MADDLVDYDEEEIAVQPRTAAAAGRAATDMGLHSAGFKDFLLKPELNRAILDAAFEHPSEVQHRAIPTAILGTDIICQAKSGCGKTACFVLSSLQQLEPQKGVVSILVLCHTRELADQIKGEYLRFSKYLKDIKVEVMFGGVPIQTHQKMLKDPETVPNVIVGTPGRILALVEQKVLNLDKLKCFIVDECDRVLGEGDMRKDVQKIFYNTPVAKQVMLFTATLSADMLKTCRLFTREALEIVVEDQTKLRLHGLTQYVCRLEESAKVRKLVNLLDQIQFNQCIIFVSKHSRANELAKLLNEVNFPAEVIHAKLDQKDRLAKLEKFKKFETRILVTTDLVARGIDVERVNVSINYDFPDSSDTYLHRVNRAGRFGTKGLAVSFVSSPADEEIVKEVEKRFGHEVAALPETIDPSTYMNQ